MSRRQLRSDDEDGFLMAIHDDLTESKALFNVQVEMYLMPASTRGAFHIICYAYKRPRKPGDEPYATSSTPYPSSQAKRLHAGLYRAAIRIGGELARLHTQKEIKDSPAPSEGRQQDN